MAYRKKTWLEKLYNNNGLPKVVVIGGKMQKRWGTKPGDTCVIPAPRNVDALMKKVPPGKIITINELRNFLAKRHKATVGCPITTGIFAWIAAHAAEEAVATEAVKPKAMTPYWRTLKNKGELNPKYPGGVAALAKRLRAEGHTVIRKGMRYFVADFEKSLAKLV